MNRRFRIRLTGLAGGLLVGLVWAASSPNFLDMATTARYLWGCAFFMWIGYSLGVIIARIRLTREPTVTAPSRQAERNKAWGRQGRT